MIGSSSSSSFSSGSPADDWPDVLEGDPGLDTGKFKLVSPAVLPSGVRLPAEVFDASFELKRCSNLGTRGIFGSVRGCLDVEASFCAIA